MTNVQICPSCAKGDHSQHQPWFGGICIGCPCDFRPGEAPTAEREETDDEAQERIENEADRSIWDLVESITPTRWPPTLELAHLNLLELAAELTRWKRLIETAEAYAVGTSNAYKLSEVALDCAHRGR